MASDATLNSHGLPTKHEFKLPEIITAASAGTVIDWYDFYIFGSLSFVISPLFFPNAAGDPIQSLLEHVPLDSEELPAMTLKMDASKFTLSLADEVLIIERHPRRPDRGLGRAVEIGEAATALA